MAVTHHAALAVGGVPVLPGLGGLGIVAFRKVYFCDSRKGNDSNTGLSVEEAFSSVQSALDVVEDEDTIVVFKGTGNYDEKLATGQNIRYAAMVPGRGRNVTLAGATPTSLPYNSPQLYNVSGSEYSLFVRSPGWRITGLRIIGDTGAPRGLVAEMAQAANTAGTNWAPGLQIDHCVFLGNVDALSTGFTSTSLVNCRVFDNLFTGFTLAAFGEETEDQIVTIPGFSFPQYQILRNIFSDNKRNIDVNAQSTLIAGNTIGMNRINSMVANGGIDLDGGPGDNIVTQNYLEEQYTSGGKYRKAQSTDSWDGNWVPAGGTGVTAGMSTGLPGQCWIALAIYGPSDKFLDAYTFINYGWEGRVAKATKAVYGLVGRAIAKTPIKWLLKPLFDLAVNRGSKMDKKSSIQAAVRSLA